MAKFKNYEIDNEEEVCAIGRAFSSPIRLKILQLLYEKAGGTVGRDSIMKRLWDNECFVDDNTLTVNINRLRKKLEEAGIENFILTKKGVGYQLREA